MRNMRFNVCVADSIPIPFDTQIITTENKNEMVTLLELALKSNKEVLIVPLNKNRGEENDK